MSNNKSGTNVDFENYLQIEAEKLSLEKQVAFGIWVQTIGQVIELVSLVKLNLIEDADDAQKQILNGVSIQTLGAFFEAIGVSNEISAKDTESSIKAQKLALTGGWLQVLGSILEEVSAGEIIKEEETGVTKFVP